jgi:hypothetical protein
LHVLTIIRYISLALILILVISPREGGGTIFLLLMAGVVLLIVTDIYAAAIIERRFMLFLVRVMAVALPMMMAGTGTDKSSRQLMVMVALLGLPGTLIMLFVPWFDPAQ